MVYFSPTYLWRALSEPKCKFFAWLALHNKILTTDNMAKKKLGLQSICPLCFCMPEIVDHLLTKCNFPKALWHTLAQRLNLPQYNLLNSPGGPLEWVYHLATDSSSSRRKRLGLVFFIWWNLCEERNRRIFETKEKSIPQLATLVLEEITNFSRALSSSFSNP
jgi:hypothetical protein